MIGRIFTLQVCGACAVAAAALAISAPLAAQATLDRNAAPKAGASPKLRVPTWTKTKLANGADLIVIEKHDLPLVAFTIDFVGG